MDSLFSRDHRPLAELLRPRTLAEIIGQDHLLVRNAPLEVALRTGRIQNLVLHGPPGVGKTTVARALAQATGAHFEAISATSAGKSDFERIVKDAKIRAQSGQKSVLFLDELHRWSRTQQDALLPHVENGALTLIGATSENPGFVISPALRSRARIVELRSLTPEDIEAVIARAERVKGPAPLTPEARASVAQLSGGDARAAIGMLEAAYNAEPDAPLTAEELAVVAPSTLGRHGRNREALYDLLSALHKSMRGSDPDAACLYAAMLLEGGEDPFAVIRRVQACASEDVGLADPQAMVQADAAWSAMLRLGPAEGMLPLFQAVIYVATAPKSAATYQAMNRAFELARAHPDLMPPLHMMNAPTAYQRSLGRKDGYAWDHDYDGAFSGQQRLPNGLTEEVLYDPSPRGWEAVHLRPRLEKWRSLRAQSRPTPQGKPSP